MTEPRPGATVGAGEGSDHPAPAAAATEGGRWRVTAWLAALAAAVRALYWLSTAGQPVMSDAFQYHELGAHLADGLGYSSQFPQFEVHATAWRPPVLPAILGVVYRFVGVSEGAARSVALVIGVALVVVCHRVLRRHLDERVAVLAAGLVACYPPLVANDTVPLTESLSLILLLLLADAVVRRRPIVAGVAFAVLLLTRPSAQALVLVLVPVLVLAVGWWRAATGLAVAALVIAPWLVRNHVELGLHGIVSSNGFNLAAVYSAEAQAAGHFINPIVDPGFEDTRLLQIDEADWDATLRRRAVDDLRQNPDYVVRVAGRNTLAMLEIDTSTIDDAELDDGRNATVRQVGRPLFWLVTATGVVGVWRARRRPFVLTMAAFVAVFVAQDVLLLAWPRLRAPLDLLCCIGVAIVVDALLRRRTPRHGAAGPTIDAQQGAGAAVGSTPSPGAPIPVRPRRTDRV